MDVTEIIVAVISALSAIGTAWLASQARNTSVKRAAKRNGWDHLIEHIETQNVKLSDKLMASEHKNHELADRLYETREEAVGTEFILNKRIRELEHELHELREGDGSREQDTEESH